MLPLNKLLRIALPLGTATTAALITTVLLSINRDDLDKKKENEDKELEDFVDPVKDFEEEKILESKDQGGGEEIEKEGSEQDSLSDSGDGEPKEEEEESFPKAPKIDINKLDELAENVVFEGLASIEKAGQKSNGGAPKEPLNKDERSELFEANEELGSDVSSDGINVDGSAKGPEGDKMAVESSDNFANPDLTNREGDQKELERGNEREGETTASSLEEEVNDLSENKQEGIEGEARTSNLLEKEISEVEVQEHAGPKEADGLLPEREHGQEQPAQKAEKDISKDGENDHEEQQTLDGGEVNQKGAKGGNSDQSSEEAIKELEEIEEQLIGFESNLEDLLR